MNHVAQRREKDRKKSNAELGDRFAKEKKMKEARRRRRRRVQQFFFFSRNALLDPSSLGHKGQGAKNVTGLASERERERGGGGERKREREREEGERERERERERAVSKQIFNWSTIMGLCALHHGIQISIEAILGWHPARSTE